MAFKLGGWDVPPIRPSDAYDKQKFPPIPLTEEFAIWARTCPVCGKVMPEIKGVCLHIGFVHPHWPEGPDYR